MPFMVVISKVMMSLVRELASVVVNPRIAMVSALSPKCFNSLLALSKSSLIC